MHPAYVAGLIDGEGCVHLATRKGTYRGRVTVGMTDPARELLATLQDQYGGSTYRLRPATDAWAAAWTWSLQGSATVPMLQGLLPYLILKRPQALLVLDVENVRTNLPRRPNGSGSWTDPARAECEKIKAQLHLLNRKGARATIAEAA